MDKDIAWLVDAKGHETMFKYTHCFDSADADAKNYAKQKDVYDMVGRSVLDNVFQGLNACILAYGQTGVSTPCVFFLFAFRVVCYVLCCVVLCCVVLCCVVLCCVVLCCVVLCCVVLCCVVLCCVVL